MGVKERGAREAGKRGLIATAEMVSFVTGECLTFFATKNCTKRTSVRKDAVAPLFSPFKHSVLAASALTTTTTTRQPSNDDNELGANTTHSTQQVHTSTLSG